jgi:hypothetical protein
MRIHPVNFLVAMVVSALLAIGISSIHANAMKAAIGTGSFVFFASTLATAFGFTYEFVRTGVNLKIVAFIFFLIALLLNLVFALTSFPTTSYVVTCGIAFFVFVPIASAIYGTKQ